VSSITPRLLVLGGLLLVIGCKERALPSPPAPPRSTAEEETRALALAASPGAAAVDQLIQQLQEAARTSPGKVDAWLALGQAWIRKARGSADPGYYLNADACAGLALKLSPESPLALSLRALVLLNDHRFSQARELARRIVQAHPDDPMALGILSDASLELGAFEEAADAAQRMMDIKPNLPSYSRASHLRWLQGDRAGAKELARHAIDAGRDTRDLEPFAWMLVQAAMLFWHEGDYEGAEAGFDEALKRVEDYAPALVGKGRVALARGDARRAVALLERAHAKSPLAETAWLLGDARRAAGDEPGAQSAFAAVVKAGRRTDRLTLVLFYATYDRQRGEAVELCEAERALRPSLYVEDACAWALYRVGRLPEARAAIDRATALGTQDARLLFHAGAIRIAQGEMAEGRAQVARALALNPRFDERGAAEARRLLALTGAAGGRR
jgi:tetratricopeptide (TPR) repeat protein